MAHDIAAAAAAIISLQFVGRLDLVLVDPFPCPPSRCTRRQGVVTNFVAEEPLWEATHRKSGAAPPMDVRRARAMERGLEWRPRWQHER